MSVVFDEIIANVEAPPPGAQADAAEGTNSIPEKDDEKISRIFETNQRRAYRLMAD